MKKNGVYRCNKLRVNDLGFPIECLQYSVCYRPYCYKDNSDPRMIVRQHGLLSLVSNLDYKPIKSLPIELDLFTKVS